MSYQHFLNRTMAMIGLTMALALSVASAQNAPDISGSWRGVIKLGEADLRIRFQFERDENGNYSGSMDSIDQGATGIPMTDIEVAGGQLSLKVPPAQATYTGQLLPGAQKIEGHWQQGPNQLPLTLQRSYDEEKIQRPQEPTKPYPYRAEEIHFANAQADIELAGTLTLPDGDGPFPAAVLISGSGPQDRDEAFMSHRPFLVLADHLTRNGIAVLRYDDRGVGDSGGDFATATSADFATDADAAVRYLAQRDEIDHQAIGLIGHSEGGLVAPMVAVDNDQVAYVVMMAGPGMSGMEIAVLQMRMVMEYRGASKASVEAAADLYRSMNEMVAGKPAEEVSLEQLESAFAERWNALDENVREELKQMGATGELSDSRKSQLMSPWTRYFWAYDPAPTLRQLDCPVLAINGGKDVQMVAEPNLQLIESSLAAGGNEHYEVRLMPGLNHLFQEAETGLMTEYAKIEQTIAPAALTLMSDWIRQVTE
ncbi:MAG: alpha/beta fold hydrolase [Wenzhouxiangellaceae bacterium]